MSTASFIRGEREAGATGHEAGTKSLESGDTEGNQPVPGNLAQRTQCFRAYAARLSKRAASLCGVSGAGNTVEGCGPRYDPRLSFASALERTQQSIGGAGAGLIAVDVQMAGAGRNGQAEPGGAGLHAAPAQKVAASAYHGGTQRAAQLGNAGNSSVS